MRFTNLIAAVAISTLAVTASAQNEQQGAASTAKEVNININTNAQQASQQPTTVVEAAPAQASKAEAMRKARQDAEVQTEQKIVEKLEDSRLQEEKARADRLFGNKLDGDKAAAPAAAVVAAPIVAPAQEAKPTQVTIEKVEIIQPKAEAAPVAESKIEAKGESAAPSSSKYYISGMLGNTSYNASNVKSNYGLGVAVGTIIDERWGVELAYMYSNHNVDDIWPGSPLYHRLDQSDFSGAAKFYILQGKLKPYVGGSLTYINRKYTEKVYNAPWFSTNTSENTSAVDAGILGGVDFALTDSFMLGAGMDYNFNVMNVSDFNDKAYGLPPGYSPLEKINYWTMKVTAKFVF